MSAAEPHWAWKLFREQIGRVVVGGMLALMYLSIAPVVDTIKGLSTVSEDVAALRAEVVCIPGATPLPGSLCAEVAALRTEIEKAADLPEQIRMLQAEIATLRADLAAQEINITSLLRPTQIFRVGPVDPPVECSPGRECSIVVLIHRLIRAIDCDLRIGQGRYRFYSSDLTREIETSRMQNAGTPQRNVGTGWTELTLVVQTPQLGYGPAWFAFEPSYDKCLGPADSVIVSQESDLIPVSIVPHTPEIPSDAPVLPEPASYPNGMRP